jgi:hypothetical protein
MEKMVAALVQQAAALKASTDLTQLTRKNGGKFPTLACPAIHDESRFDSGPWNPWEWRFGVNY